MRLLHLNKKCQYAKKSKGNKHILYGSYFDYLKKNHLPELQFGSFFCFFSFYNKGQT